MMALQARSVYLAVLAMSFIGGAAGQVCADSYDGIDGYDVSNRLVACCSSTECDNTCQQDCQDTIDTEEEDRCCVQWIVEKSELTCGGETKAPCALSVCEVDNAGTDGYDQNGDLAACCLSSCDECLETCQGTIDMEEEDRCCVQWIVEEGDQTCGEEIPVNAPCALSETPATTPTPSQDTTPTPSQDTTPTPSPETTIAPGTTFGGDDGGDSSSASVIALAVVLALVLVGNAAFCLFFYFKRKNKSPPPTHSQIDPQANAELGHLRNAHMAEKSRRIQAEALINRVRGGGLDAACEFPSVRDVYQHVRQLADVAIGWSEKAAAIGGSHPALPATFASVMKNTFIVCREEVKRSLAERVEHLKLFLGNEEPVVLSGGDAMNLDTQYVLYEVLCKSFRKIVQVEPQDMEKLANAVLQRCDGPADAQLATDILFGSAWPSYDVLMQEYMLVFVEMELQNPAMAFEEEQLGQTPFFDPAIHRDWAPYSQDVAGEQCCIVFPELQQQEGRPPVVGKLGVVRIPG